MYHMYASKLDLKGFFFSKIEPLNPHFARVMSLDTHFWGKSLITVSRWPLYFGFVTLSSILAIKNLLNYPQGGALIIH